MSTVVTVCLCYLISLFCVGCSTEVIVYDYNKGRVIKTIKNAGGVDAVKGGIFREMICPYIDWESKTFITMQKEVDESGRESQTLRRYDQQGHKVWEKRFHFPKFAWSGEEFILHGDTLLFWATTLGANWKEKSIDNLYIKDITKSGSLRTLSFEQIVDVGESIASGASHTPQFVELANNKILCFTSIDKDKRDLGTVRQLVVLDLKTESLQMLLLKPEPDWRHGILQSQEGKYISFLYEDFNIIIMNAHLEVVRHLTHSSELSSLDSSSSISFNTSWVGKDELIIWDRYGKWIHYSVECGIIATGKIPLKERESIRLFTSNRIAILSQNYSWRSSIKYLYDVSKNKRLKTLPSDVGKIFPFYNGRVLMER